MTQIFTVNVAQDKSLYLRAQFVVHGLKPFIVRGWNARISLSGGVTFNIQTKKFVVVEGFSGNACVLRNGGHVDFGGL